MGEEKIRLESEDTCKDHSIDEKKVKTLKEIIPEEKDIFALAETFKALSDPTRVKIIFCLSKKELCVHELAALLNMSLSAISHQLRILRNMRLVKFRKEGKKVFYLLDDRHIENLFNQGWEHVRE